MPQVRIDHIIDPIFLAKEANIGNNWGIINDPEGVYFTYMSYDTDAVEAAIEEFPTSYLSYLVDQKLEALANIRRVKELKGPSGLTLDDKTIARLTAAAVGLLIDESRETIRWEMSRGVFTTIPRDTVLMLSAGAVNAVQLCFDVVYEKTQLIKAVTLTDNTLEALVVAKAELDAIDLTTDWPD